MSLKEEIKKCEKPSHKMGGGSSCAVYGLGLVGAFVFYVQHAQSFTEGLIGFVKALVWPALLVYKLIELLKF